MYIRHDAEIPMACHPHAPASRDPERVRREAATVLHSCAMGAGSSRPEAAGAPAGSKAPHDLDTLYKEQLAMEAAATPLDEVPSCLNLFDKWLSCYALGPQMRNVYRYGAFTDCSAKREDFKFCLTMRGLEPEARRHEWLARRAEKQAHERLGPRSSENVWEMRRDPVVPHEYEDPAYPSPA